MDTIFTSVKQYICQEWLDDDYAVARKLYRVLKKLLISGILNYILPAIETIVTK